MANPKPPASRVSKPLQNPREIPAEYLVQVGQEISRQLEKAKPLPDKGTLARKEAPMAWSKERAFDENAKTDKFVRADKGDLTDRVELLLQSPTQNQESPKSFWERFKGLMGRLF